MATERCREDGVDPVTGMPTEHPEVPDGSRHEGMPPAPPPEDHPPYTSSLLREVSQASTPSPLKVVFLAYSYHSVPDYVAELRKDLAGAGYHLFDPLAAVESQFEPEQLQPLLSLACRAPEEVRRALRLPQALAKPANDPQVVADLRRGDSRSDVDALMFKEIYFLSRSCLVLCDLVPQPTACELYHKVVLARAFGVPAIGIAPAGRVVSAYLQRHLKVVLTDDFTTDNILPLVRAFGG